ncbi:hypothetical protein IIV22A_099R [Invertebrate iridescent virus 22]|uniref:Transcription factor TFIIB cyclin-like domain-containing protein n=1 Tax=Invertebrate iridescent virus 22 TaxID=345198 RepID=W8W1D4_9VIRU|nr:hypothetical protein IIV22A_099R [Invertebrate iridescent virus 22]CCV01943.1 hypothetical protein IIV22A_099R [Invertebrate iridescent virus 22]
MCNHHNIVLDVCGTSTCADCYIHFDKSFCSEFTTNYNGPILNLLKTKSTIINTLEKDFGVCDRDTTLITEKIFNLTSKNKMVKGTNKRSILCASLYYAYHYLEKPTNFEDMLIKFKINHKNGSKGLKLCQIAIQECPEVVVNNELKIHSFASTHKEKLQELISRYNISLTNYDEIEKIIITSHLKRGKILNNRINRLWISCIFFWLLKINPYIDPEEFISINSDYSTLTQLKADLNYLTKNLN